MYPLHLYARVLTYLSVSWYRIKVTFYSALKHREAGKEGTVTLNATVSAFRPEHCPWLFKIKVKDTCYHLYLRSHPKLNITVNPTAKVIILNTGTSDIFPKVFRLAKKIYIYFFYFNAIVLSWTIHEKYFMKVTSCDQWLSGVSLTHCAPSVVQRVKGEQHVVMWASQSTEIEKSWCFSFLCNTTCFFYLGIRSPWHALFPKQFIHSCLQSTHHSGLVGHDKAVHMRSR